jgi:acetyl esterase
MLFFHGGGWVGFDLDTHDPLCRDLCARSRHLIVSVDYRLAPEHPFPDGVNDCLAALDWLIVNAERLGGRADRIVICGDSAGGNLAAVVALQARTRHPGRLSGQVLIYPVTDHYTAQWPSYASCGGKEYPLTRDGIEEIWNWYVRDSREWQPGQTSHDLATPYRVKDVSGLPRTLFIIASDDLLRDEGLAYADRMEEAGNKVKTRIFPGQKHGFVGTEPSAAHSEAIAEIAQWLQQA